MIRVQNQVGEEALQLSGRNVQRRVCNLDAKRAEKPDFAWGSRGEHERSISQGGKAIRFLGEKNAPAFQKRKSGDYAIIDRMERWKRLIYYLLINVAVSACTILTVLFLWERFNPPQGLVPVTVTQVQPTGTTPVEDGIPLAAPPETTETVDTTSAAPGATSPPAATPASNGLETYEVQSGDTLGAIASAYGLTIEEILAVNELENPDVLDVGDVIFIPIPAGADDPAATEVAQPTNTLAPPTPGVLVTSTPLPAGFDPEVEIVTVVAAGNLPDERVVIRLNGEGTLALRDWYLEDEDGNLYVFPELTLFKDGAVTVYTKGGTNNVVELFWGLSAALWESGETVSLVDPQGKVQATYQVP
jgi:LysM repeat protein